MLTTALRRLRRRSRLRHRRHPHRDRAGRRGRIRAGVRRRGGRERRVVPAAVARTAAVVTSVGSRPPGQLRAPGRRSRPPFAAFARRIMPGGVLVACADDPGAAALAAAPRRSRSGSAPTASAATPTTGSPSVVPRGMSVSLAVAARPTGAAGQMPPARLTVGVPGRHNALNAAAAFAAVLELGLPPCGPGRPRPGWPPTGARGGGWSPRARAGGVHGPRQLRPPPDRARRRPAGGAGHRSTLAGQVIAIFQPHLFSRDPDLRQRVRRRARPGRRGRSCSMSTRPARIPEPGVTGELVAPRGARRPGGLPARRRRPWPGAVADTARPGDLILTMGAGDVTAQGPLIVAALAGPRGVRRGCERLRPPRSRLARASRGPAPGGVEGRVLRRGGHRDRRRGGLGAAGIAVPGRPLGPGHRHGPHGLAGRKCSPPRISGTACRSSGSTPPPWRTGSAGSARCESAQVSRHWPHTVVISVRLRTPVFAVAVRGGYALVDAFGVDVRDSARRPPRLPLLALATGTGVSDAGGVTGSDWLDGPAVPLIAAPGSQAAAAVLRDLPPQIARQCAPSVSAASASDVSLAARERGGDRLGRHIAVRRKKRKS